LEDHHTGMTVRQITALAATALSLLSSKMWKADVEDTNTKKVSLPFGCFEATKTRNSDHLPDQLDTLEGSRKCVCVLNGGKCGGKTGWIGRGGRSNVKRFRGGLVFKANRLVYHSTLGLRVIKKEGDQRQRPREADERSLPAPGPRVRERVLY